MNTAQPVTRTVLSGRLSAVEPVAYKIGFSGPLSGDNDYYGKASREGIELAVAEINSAGGINGIPITVVYEDDRNDPALAQKVLLKLVEKENVPIIIGINTSSVTLATCRQAEILQVVQYSIGSNPKIGSQCGDFTFQFQGNDIEQAEAFTRIVQRLGAKKVAVVFMNNDYGIGNRFAFVNPARTAGIQILGEIPLQPGQKDYTAEVNQLKSLNPPVTAFIAYGAEGAAFLRQASENGIQTQYIGDTNWGDESMWQVAGEVLTGLIGLRAGVHTSPEYLAFEKKFEAHYNKPPSIWSEYFYDEVHIAARAIALGGYTGSGIRDATKKICETYVGASGPKQLDADNYVRWSFDWVQWQPGGKLKPFK